MSKQKMSYEAALQELQEIVDLLQEEAIGIDTLSEKVKRAAELIRFCREKLRSTEEDVKNVMSDW
jgi:exodeoxyribonuclease VII small subunit